MLNVNFKHFHRWVQYASLISLFWLYCLRLCSLFSFGFCALIRWPFQLFKFYITTLPCPWFGYRLIACVIGFLQEYFFRLRTTRFFTKVISVYWITECCRSEAGFHASNSGLTGECAKGYWGYWSGTQMRDRFPHEYCHTVTNTNVHALLLFPPCGSVSLSFLPPFTIWKALNVANDSFLIISFPPLSPSLSLLLPPPAPSVPALPCCSGRSHHISSCDLLCLPADCLLPPCLPFLWLAAWFILLSAPCRCTLGGAPLLWTGYVWEYLPQRWAKCRCITRAALQGLRETFFENTNTTFFDKIIRIRTRSSERIHSVWALIYSFPVISWRLEMFLPLLRFY